MAIQKKKEPVVLNADDVEKFDSKKRENAKIKLENELQREESQFWEDEELEKVARKAANDRYLALQSSSCMGEIARRILMGQPPREIAQTVIITYAQDFETILPASLALQIENFKRDLMAEIFKRGQEHMQVGKVPDINPIDMEVIRFKDRAMVVQAMMERAVLFQEARLIKAMSIERAINTKGDEDILSPVVDEAYDRYMNALSRLGNYKKLIGKEDDGDSAVRELTHNFKQMSKVYALMPADSKEKFREQIEQLSRQKAAEEGRSAQNSPTNDATGESTAK